MRIGSPFFHFNMGRVLAIDYGRKRCGVAVTDVLRIAANPLPVQRTCDLMDFLKNYCSAEPVDLVVIGKPLTMRGEASESWKYIEPFVRRLRREMPGLKVEFADERFTSAIAHREMIAGGFKRSDRQRKGFADEMAATIILTDWLSSHC